jgi:hypothetical protein
MDDLGEHGEFLRQVYAQADGQHIDTRRFVKLLR